VRRRSFVLEGRVEARAVVLDVATIGEAEARRRALALLDPGTTVHDLGADGWLVLLAEPLELDAWRFPGAPLVERDGRLVGAVDTGESGDIAYWRGASVTRRTRTSAPQIDPADWIDTSALPVLRIDPVERPRHPEPAEPPPPKRPDLRRAARVRERSAESREVERLLSGGSSGPGRTRGRAAGGGQAPLSARERLGSLLAGLTLRTPLAWEVRRRQVRYLERLADQFGQDVDEALRNAIPLGGLGPAARSLRLPAPRRTLTITGGGLRRRTVGVGGDAYAALRAMYQRAAERLEGDGRIEEAAFVLVELLNNPWSGVALLERHKRWELAARVAEERGLEAAAVVRLWWLGGDRERAVLIARRRGAFAAALSRVAQTDAALARELRLAWVDALERAGDLLAAVMVAWPDPHLRPLLRNVVDRGIALGGSTAAAMHAYRLGLAPTDDELDATRQFVARLGPQDADLVLAFAVALADVAPEPSVDREMASSALRRLVSAPVAGAAGATAARVREALRRRADPLLHADLPAVRAGSARVDEALVAPAQPAGVTPILDAVPLPGGRTLVGLGEAGCRLLSPDGRTVAAWDVPTHAIVAADHGGSALLLARRGAATEVVALDLATRRARPYGPVVASQAADTFDGATWAAVDERGIAFLDLLAERPTVAWRELEPAWTCHALARDSEQLAALVTVVDQLGAGRLESWWWHLPAMALRARVGVAAPGAESPDAADRATAVAMLADASLVWTLADGRRQWTDGPRSLPLDWAAADDRLTATQRMVTRIRPSQGGYRDVTVHRRSDPDHAAITVPGMTDGAAARSVGALVAVWDGTGRLVTADLDARRLVTVTRLTT
jgi:hypothetical protein